MAKIKAIPKSYHPTELEVNAYRFCLKELKVYYSMECTPGGFHVVRGSLNDLLQANREYSYKRVDLSKPDKKGNRVVFDKISAEKEIFKSYLELFNIKNK
jgi:hypothetical protein